MTAHRSVGWASGYMREVVSSTPAGPTLRVLKEDATFEREYYLCNYISKWLDFQVFPDEDYKPEVPSHNARGAFHMHSADPVELRPS